MAEVDTWPSIKQRGLLSTSAVLDKLGITGAARAEYETEHRPEKMTVGQGANAIVLRDQKPMPPDRIVKALVDGTTPQQWYSFLNGKVFMWAEEERLLTLLNARPYKKLEHDVLTIDTAALVADYKDKISLCRMNSGNTFPMWLRRGLDDFKSIDAYPAKRSGDPEKTVVEVVVDYAISDLAKYVVQVRRMKSKEVLSDLPLSKQKRPFAKLQQSVERLHGMKWSGFFDRKPVSLHSAINASRLDVARKTGTPAAHHNGTSCLCDEPDQDRGRRQSDRQ